MRILAMALCPSVCLCLSMTSRSSIKTAERIELILVLELLSTHPTLCEKEILVSPRKGTFLWNFLPNSGLKISLRYIDRGNVINFVRDRWTLKKRENRIVVDQLS